MANNYHGRAEKELVQEEILLDDPNFLKEIVRRVLQQVLEAEMTEHVGAPLPMSARRTPKDTATATREGC